MNLEECWDAYKDFAGKASEVARTLAFAGIALLWIFKEEETNKLPAPLILPALLFASSLGLDLLHYAYGALVWGWRHRHEERKLEDSSKAPAKVEFAVAPCWNWPTIAFFWGKIALVIFGFSLTICYIYGLWTA